MKVQDIITLGNFTEFSHQAANHANSETKFWIGVTNSLTNEWINVHDKSEAKFFNWASRESNTLNKKEGCVSMDMSGYWYSSDCSSNLPYVCEISISSTAGLPMTTSSSSETCANGGISMNGVCICPPNWIGSQCTVPICQNNGTVDPAGYCKCQPGTVGEFCQYFECAQQNNQMNFDSQDRHMMFILDITNRNAQILFELTKYITEVVRDISTIKKDWISKLTVVGVDSSGTRILGTSKAGNVGKMQAIFNHAYQIAVNSTDSNTHIPLYHALTKYIHILNHNSFINIFTVAAPRTTEINVINEYERFLSRKLILNVYVATDGNGNYLSGKDSDWAFIRNLSVITTGRFMKMELLNIYTGLKLIPTWYSSQIAYYKNFDDCTDKVSVLVPVDAYTQSVQIYVNGKNAANTSTVSVQLPNGTSTTAANLMVNDLANGFGVYDIRRTCDTYWEDPRSPIPYCFRAFFFNGTWNEARQICTDAGGFLVDDMNQDKDDFVSLYSANKPIWIALNSLNGEWNWDYGAAEFNSPYVRFPIAKKFHNILFRMDQSLIVG